MIGLLRPPDKARESAVAFGHAPPARQPCGRTCVPSVLPADHLRHLFSLGPAPAWRRTSGPYLAKRWLPPCPRPAELASVKRMGVAASRGAFPASNTNHYRGVRLDARVESHPPIVVGVTSGKCASACRHTHPLDRSKLGRPRARGQPPFSQIGTARPAPGRSGPEGEEMP